MPAHSLLTYYDNTVTASTHKTMRRQALFVACAGLLFLACFAATVQGDALPLFVSTRSSGADAEFADMLML